MDVRNQISTCFIKISQKLNEVTPQTKELCLGLSSIDLWKLELLKDTAHLMKDEGLNFGFFRSGYKGLRS